MITANVVVCLNFYSPFLILFFLGLRTWISLAPLMPTSLDYLVLLYSPLLPIRILQLLIDSPLLLVLLILHHDLLLVPFVVVAVVLVPLLHTFVLILVRWITVISILAPLTARAGAPLPVPPSIALLVLPRLVVLPLVVPLCVLLATVALLSLIFILKECHRPFGLFFRLAWLSSLSLTM